MIETINKILSPIEAGIRTHRTWVSYVLLIVAYCPILTYLTPEVQKDLGGIAYWLLFIILALPPLSRVTGIKLITLIMGFRKELGILMGVLVLMHYTLFVKLMGGFAALANMNPEPWFIAGFIALITTVLLLITSNTWSMKLLGKWWKRLHKGVYLIAILVVAHVLLLSPARIEYLVPVILYAIIKIADLASVRLHARNS